MVSRLPYPNKLPLVGTTYYGGNFSLHHTAFPRSFKVLRLVFKTRIVCLPDGEKNLKICLLVLTEFTSMTDGRTDGQTPHGGSHDIGRACIASRGKKTDDDDSEDNNSTLQQRRDTLATCCLDSRLTKS